MFGPSLMHSWHEGNNMMHFHVLIYPALWWMHVLVWLCGGSWAQEGVGGPTWPLFLWVRAQPDPLSPGRAFQKSIHRRIRRKTLTERDLDTEDKTWEMRKQLKTSDTNMRSQTDWKMCLDDDNPKERVRLLFHSHLWGSLKRVLLKYLRRYKNRDSWHTVRV